MIILDTSFTENARSLNDLPILVVEKVFEHLRPLVDVLDFSNIIVTCRLWSELCNNDDFIASSEVLSLARLRFNKKSAIRTALGALTPEIRDRFENFVSHDIRACEWLMENVDLFDELPLPPTYFFRDIEFIRELEDYHRNGVLPVPMEDVGDIEYWREARIETLMKSLTFMCHTLDDMQLFVNTLREMGIDISVEHTER